MPALSGNNAIYNSAAICFDGKPQEYCDKMLLPTYDVFDEKRFFHPGQSPKVFKIPISGGSRKIGVQICEDLWDDDYNCKVSAIQKEMGAELIINISASPYHENKMLLNYNKLDQYGLPRIVLDAEFKENEKKMKEDWKVQAAEMLEYAGCKDVKINDSNAPIGKGIHEMGTARMGRDPKTSVLNKFNQIHAVKNVFVTDGSFMTSAANQNL